AEAETLSLSSQGSVPSSATLLLRERRASGHNGGDISVGAATTFNATFNGTTATWDFGALLLEISGEGAVQIFPANAANGLGSSTPPVGLMLPPTTLAALGFPSFSAVNPTITLILADTNYADNSGQFVITQTPKPGTGMLVAAAGCLL